MRFYKELTLYTALSIAVILLGNTASATDYILDTPGSTVTNGSGTTHVVGSVNTPDISAGLADGDTLRLTESSGGGDGEYSIHTPTSSTFGILGSTGKGNNTIILESGSKVYSEGSHASGVIVYGTTSDFGIIGNVGGVADNTVIANGSITTLGASTQWGIYGSYNNRIVVNGSLDINTTSTHNVIGLHFDNNNSLDINGNITTTTHSDSIAGFGVEAAHNNDINVSGTIVSNGGGIVVENKNRINLSGNINIVGIYGTAIKVENSNSIDLTGSIDSKCIGLSSEYGGNEIIIHSPAKVQTGDTGINLSGINGNGNVVYCSGDISGKNSLAVSAISNFFGKSYGANAFYLLSGASLSGDIYTYDSSGASDVSNYLLTSQLILGYARDAAGRADRSKVDNSFDFVFNDDIKISGSAAWDAFLAGGTITLNGSTNQLCRVFVGADSFDGTNVADGHDASFNYQSAALGSVSGAAATLTVNGNITTVNAAARAGGLPVASPASVTVGAGSTYNLNGTHTHEFGNTDSFKVLGTLNLGANSQIVDYLHDDDAVLTLGGKAGNGLGATVGGTLNSYAAAQTLGLNVYSGSAGKVNVKAGSLTLDSFTNNGRVDFNVAKTASLRNNSGSEIDLSGTKGSLTLELGYDSNPDVYARTTGAFKSAGLTAANSIYALKGFVGNTYAGVFDTQVLDENGNPYATGTELNNALDLYRRYTLSNNGRDILVDNSDYMRRRVIELGGNEEEADAANNLIECQKDFDLAGKEFTNTFASLPDDRLLLGTRELIGEDGTTETVQSGLMSVNAAVGAVREQMTSFRMGRVSSGMASSFSSAGSTAATGNMADAEELADAYSDMSSGFNEDITAYRKLTVWANAYGGLGQQETISNTTGYDFWNAGTMVGLDYVFGRELRVGGLFGYSYNDTEVFDNRGDSNDHALRAGAYASYNWDDFFVDLSSTLGVHLIESNRNLVTNGLTAKSERTAIDFNINTTVGYTFTLPADIRFTPSYSLGYTLFHDPKSTETGGGTGNMTYSSFDSNSLLQDIGVRLGRLFRVNSQLAFMPEAWGGWEVEYLNTGGNRDATTSSSIGGNTYATSMAGLATHRGYWGAGLTALIKDNISVFGRYDHKVWHKGYNIGFSAGVKVSF